ncbi:MAG: Holliday junction resolvase RuvX [Actinomycetales bacterium]|nr:Holliday junction resolvase RuvX [Actinomycetales bacterium]
MTELPESGIRVAFDIGSARVGVSRCDQEQILALPVTTLASGDSLMSDAIDLINQFGARVVYVGLPINLQGKNTQSTESAISFAQNLTEELNQRANAVQVRLVDERLSTAVATRSMQASGRSAKSSKEVVDQAAAVEILESAIAIEKRTQALAGRPI